MPDLLEPADAGRGDREVVASGEWRVASQAPATPTTALSSLATRHSPLATQAVLLLDRVSKWYGPVIGINQVTLELRPGITGLVGSNGSGKSTLLRLAAGHLRPDLGSVRVCGHDTWGAAAKRHIGYCPELDTFYEEMSGRRFVEVMARLCGFDRREARRRTGAILELVGMAGRADGRLRGYSKGMRQR